MARFQPVVVRCLFLMFCGTAYSSDVAGAKRVIILPSNNLVTKSAGAWGVLSFVGQKLTSGSTFILLTSLLLALLFHPFGGSLVYGPSLRLWLAAPTSIAAEIGVILSHILRYFWLKWKSIFRYGLQHDTSLLTFRNQALCLVVARTTNTIDADRRRKLLSDDAKVVKMIKRSMKNIHEGWRVRLAVVLPVLAQYIKIMAVSGPGTITLRVLGTLYVTHWIILEALLLVAQMGDEPATISRVKELMLPHEHANVDLTAGFRKTPESTLIYESISYIIHQVGFVICSLVMIYCWSGHVLALLLIVIIPWVWLVKTGLQLRQRAGEFAAAVGDRVDWKEAMVSLTFGGPSVGPDVGCIFFIFWILYCACIYDSNSTSRPQWPWLDWLG